MDYESLTDEGLVAVAKDDPKAFECLYARYKNLVLSISRSYFLNGGDMDDLLQVGMIGVFKAVISYNGKASFKNYASKCVKTNIISAIKTTNGNKQKALNNFISLTALTEDDTDKNSFISDGADNPEESYINKESFLETRQKIKSALSKYEYKICVLFLKGYSYEYISKKTNKNIKSIDNAIQRIRKKLAVIL